MKTTHYERGYIVNLVIKTKISLIILTLFFSVTSFAQIGNDKALFVDFFGLSIFNIDEDGAVVGPTAFERQDALFKYIDDHGITTIILKSLDGIEAGSAFLFPKTNATTYPVSGSGKEQVLANFLHECRYTHGVSHIAAGDTPSRSNGSINYFYDNIILFNAYSIANFTYNSGTEYGYFDMLYGETDYWGNSNDLTTPAGRAKIMTDWNNYIGLNGFQHIKSLQNSNPTIPVVGDDLLISTYLGNLNNVTAASPLVFPNTTVTQQNQVDLIDANVDWVFLAFYFQGSQMSPTKFFSVDGGVAGIGGNGKRLELFSKNDDPTVIIPLFGSSSANINGTGSDKNYFGDYLKYDNLTTGIFTPIGQSVLGTSGTLDDVKDLFEYYYNNTINPYGETTGPHLTKTMREICETDVVTPNEPNIMNKGVGWFKFSTMPDAKYFLKFNDDDVIGALNANTLTVSADDLITTGTAACTTSASTCKSLQNATSLFFDLKNYKWYYQGSTYPTLTSSFTFNPVSTAISYLTAEFEVTAYEEPGFVTPVTGTFDHIKIRKTFKVDPFLVGSSTDHFNISTFTAPSCPSFDNGSISIEWSPTPNTGYQYYLYGYFKSTNTTSTPDAIGSSCNGYTVTDLTADTYTVKLYTGICYGSGNSITYSALTPVFTSGPSPQIISTTFILNNSSTIPEPQIITSELNEINCNPDLTATSISGATYEWKDINGQVVSTVQNFTASENGTYTVTVTDAQGCVGTSAPYVLKMKPTPTIEGSDITCETNKTYTVTADLNNPTYNWTIPGTVIAIEVANSITITDWDIYENTGATISCEVTNGCGESATAYFTVNGCCSPTNRGADINNYTLSSSASMNGTYHVNGILAVTSGTLTLDGADMTFGDEAKILVATGCTLNIVNSTHLYACDPNIRWQGIVLEDRAVLLIDGAMIENAISAVTCNGSEVEYSISTALFNNNNAGIQINGDGTSTVFDGTVTNSVFTARNISFSNVPALINTLKGTNNSTNIDSYSKLDTRCNVGIDVLNVGTTSTAPVYNLKIGEAGTFSSKGNIFDNCNYGVRTNQSNVEIVNNLFQQMEGGLAFGKKTIGIAIFGSNGINTTNQYCLKIGGSNTNEKNTILDCGIGILAVEYTHALIAKNDISKTAGIGSYSASNYTGRLGIKLVNKHRSNFDCNNNTLSNIYYGIEWSQNLSNDVEGNFNSNTIGTSSTGEDCYTAINLNGVGNFIDRSCEIEINGNTINGVLNGIKVANFKNADKINIKNNPYISLRNAQNSQYGILVTGTTNTNISDNVDIHSSGSSNKNITGIFVNNSLFSSINCNNISNIGTCVGFGGDCQNIINEGVLHRNNFSYYSTAVQILPLALLGTQGSSNNACDDEWNHTGLTSSSQDIINFSNPLDFKVRSTSLPYKPTFLLGNAIGFPLGSNSTVTCSGDPIKGSPLLPAEEKLRLTKLAINDIDYPVLAAENKWFYTQMAYEKLRVDTTLAIGDSILVAFRDSLEFGNIGKFYSVEQSIESGNWSTAETNNLAITFENHIEENLKKVNSYIIAYRADTTLGEDTTWVEDMLDNLVPIASECYTIGGPAVLSAKSMLSYFSNELFEESEDCFRALADSIVADSSNTLCGLFKSYYVPETEGATYTWTVPSGTSYIQSGNNISVNWGTIITSGGTITCLITDTLGNSSYSIYNQDALITAPTCVTVTANNTSCVTNSYLSWSAPSECAAGYYLMFGTNGGGSSDPNNITDTLDIGNVTTYSLPPYLLPNTIHYYKVIPYNNIHAPVSGCSIGSFTSGSSVAFTPTLGNPYIETFNGVTAPALPCGISVSNENFPQDNFKWETNSISSCSGNNSLTIAKNSNNTTAKMIGFTRIL
ncbi:MAG: hypothetical protein IPO70_08775 [Bacteroidetes bacterium]|nr:hypothetical protein [Bacteroidota bacterium]